MDEEECDARAERLRLRLDDLRGRFDRPTYEVLSKVLHGLRTAPTGTDRTAEADTPPPESELFTAELRQELLVVMSMLGFAEDSVILGLEDAAQERENDRREVEAIARASGMTP